MFRVLMSVMVMLVPAAFPVFAVELTVQERSGIQRIGEPVTCGVPLPPGFSEDVGELVLESGGNSVMSEIRPVNRWPDGSLRWVHLDFLTSLDAGGKKVFSLGKGSGTITDSRLSVEENSQTITVSTGKIRAEVRKKRFNLLNRLNYTGGREAALIASHNRGLSAVVDSVEYLSANDDKSTVQVESSGSMRVVLRARGGLLDKSGRKLFDYICRLYFYNGSPVVRVAYTFEYRQSAIEQKVELEAFHLEIPLAGNGKRSFRIGRMGGDLQGTLSEDESEAWVLAPSSSEYSFGGAASHGKPGNAKAEKSDRLGWIGVSSPEGAVAVGLRDFWKMHPSSLELSEGGKLIRVGMVPLRDAKTVDIYPGIARTHYLRFAFLDRDDPVLMQSYVASCQQPLVAVASPAYYCRESGAIAKLVERNAGLYPREHRELVTRLEEEIDKGLVTMLEMVDNRKKNGVTVEGYGLLEWGDGMHHIWKQGVDEPYNISWNGHYYDLPHMSFTEFLRTGDYRWLDYSLSRAYHQMDVHVTHFEPGNRFNGANRYCPPREHVRIDNGEVYVSNSCNHHKTQGMFERYYLTGDERALEVALKALEYANSFGGYGDFHQPRGAAHQVLTLMEGYKHTGDGKYLETARQTFERWWEHFENNEKKFTQGLFMVGFLLEAFVDLYQASPDERIVEFVHQAVDWMRTNRPEYYPTNMALAVGFLAERLNKPELLELEKLHLEHWSGTPANQFKDFANSGRSLARALYFLSRAAAGQH